MNLYFFLYAINSIYHFMHADAIFSLCVIFSSLYVLCALCICHSIRSFFLCVPATPGVFYVNVPASRSNDLCCFSMPPTRRSETGAVNICCVGVGLPKWKCIEDENKKNTRKRAVIWKYMWGRAVLIKHANLRLLYMLLWSDWANDEIILTYLVQFIHISGHNINWAIEREDVENNYRAFTASLKHL